MVRSQGAARFVRHQLAWKLMTGAAILVLAAGCTRTGKKDAPAKRLAAFDYSKQARRPALRPNNPLHIAATKWAQEHQKKPADAIAAVNYARTLKAIGNKNKAMEVLARTHQINPGNAKLNSEYGRLALDMGKVQMAEQLLSSVQRAKGQTDWRVLSALGTIKAKHGDHKKAQSYYHAALRQNPGATSVFNNLALSYALDGRVGDAEDLLKRAVAKGHNTRRVRQNLALVLGLQSKFGEAEKIAQTDLAGDKVDNNVTFMRSMVKTTKVAKAKTKKSKTKVAAKTKSRAKAGTITTAALPARKTKSSAPKKTATAQVSAKTQKTRKAPVKTQPEKAVQTAQHRLASKAPVTKPPVKNAKVASSTRTPATSSWKKKPATSRKLARTAKLNARPTSAPTNLAPKSNPSWSVSVSEAASTVVATAAKAPSTFEFPSAD